MKTTHDETEKLWGSLSPEVQNVIMAAGLAAKELAEFPERRRWLKIGAGFAAVRAEALRIADTNNIQHPRYRRNFTLILAKVPDLAALDKHDHASCQHAVWMHENWGVVESFLATLDIKTNNHLNHPSAIRRRYDAATKRKPQGLEKPPTPLQRKDDRIAELERQIRDLQVTGPGVDDEQDDTPDAEIQEDEPEDNEPAEEDEEEFQPRGKLDSQIFDLFKSAERNWRDWKKAPRHSEEEDEAYDKADDNSDALIKLLRRRYKETTEQIGIRLERDCLIRGDEFPYADLLDSVKKIHQIRKTENDQKIKSWPDELLNFKEFLRESLALGCWLLVCDFHAELVERLPEHPEVPEARARIERGATNSISILAKYFERAFPQIAQRMLIAEALVPMLENVMREGLLTPELKDRLRTQLEAPATE